MKSFKSFITPLFALIILASCNKSNIKFDASGSFEADETIISSEANGQIKLFTIEEGSILEAGQVVGYIDSTQLYLKKKQLQNQINALLSKKPNISLQLASLQAQLKSAETEKVRITNLVNANAATTKQLDDINTNIDVLKKQIEAQKSSLDISSEGLNKDALPLENQIEQLNDQLQKCTIVNPIKGTVLTKYAEENEMTSTGKALYKIADLSTITLRAYISGDQLPQLKLNQTVTVSVDDGKGGFKETNGTVTWINDKSEFTPKTIQTKNERANMVYAIKVKVTNDGTNKIGMYGEVNFK